jgi:hypothetical protein
MTGALDDDPSGIATYSQAGAKFGLGILWLAIFQYPLMTVIQEMCARIDWLLVWNGWYNEKEIFKEGCFSASISSSCGKYNKHRW